MKKLLIGALVGGIILFFWQFLSWTVLGTHNNMQSYSPKQTEVLQFLDQTLDEGFYYMPGLPEGSTMEENEKLLAENKGKPWAQVYFHKAENTSMNANMARGVLIDILAVLLVIWVLSKLGQHSFQEVFLCCLAIGLASYLTTAYTNGIWFQTRTMGDLIDAIAGWGLVGAWLGWWLGRKG
jgi:hypothetical protein